MDLPTKLPNYVQHRLDDVLYVAVAETGMKGKANAPEVVFVGNRKIFRTVPVLLAVVRVEMDRDEMHGSPDIAPFELLDKARSIDRQGGKVESENVEMPRVFYVRSLHGHDELFTFGKDRRIPRGNFPPAPVKLWKFFNWCSPREA